MRTCRFFIPYAIKDPEEPNSELSTALVGALYPAIGVETIGRLPPISMKDRPYGFPKTTSHHATGRKGHSS
ncbi:MAG: hypothetical protein KAV99_08085, partial [Candidatus Latescibacteria bacterium]|nr:hypothetical protein [Candidatus Latescibacterota bacterium]